VIFALGNGILVTFVGSEVLVHPNEELTTTIMLPPSVEEESVEEVAPLIGLSL
jgi:hypothetical protein